MMNIKIHPTKIAKTTSASANLRTLFKWNYYVLFKISIKNNK